MTATINPFIVYGHIPEEYFCDRKEESEKLMRYLTNQQNVVLSAERRMGKTKLVDYVFDKPEIRDAYITISIDILETSNLSEFVFSLGNAVFTRVARRSERLMKLFPMVMKSLQASFGYDPIHSTPTFDIKLGDLVRPEYTLKEIFEYLDKTDKRCLLVIDEFQQITNYPEKNVEALLRTYMQQTRNANFVFAGSQRRIMSEMFGSEKRPFFNSARQIDLEPIALSVYKEFVRHLFNINDKNIEDSAIEIVYDTFMGVTLYNQQIMNDAFDRTPHGETCSKDIADMLIDNFIAENDKRIRELLQFVPEQQKAVLYAIAQDEPVKAVTSGMFVKRHRLKSPSAVQAAIKALMRSDIITRKDGLYKISDSLMYLWIKRNVQS
ncbi:MAG: ATP-binding protein [Prevotellaceae bacterium]|nr:ATP-binding protein [Prevotellaceae bacterium]